MQLHSFALEEAFDEIDLKLAGAEIKGFVGVFKTFKRWLYNGFPALQAFAGKTAQIRGTLKGANGQPVGAADVRILIRENRLGAQYVDRGSVTTGADGRFQFTVPKGNSRFFRLAYRAYKGDDNFASRSTAATAHRATTPISCRA